MITYLASNIITHKLCCAWASPGGLVNAQIPGLIPRVSDARGLGRGLRMCVSKEAPGGADASDPESTF